MRIVKTKDGGMYLETTKMPEIVTDLLNGGRAVFFVHLPPLSELIKLIQTPLLEDIFEESRVELMERDRAEIESKGQDFLRQWELEG